MIGLLAVVVLLAATPPPAPVPPPPGALPRVVVLGAPREGAMASLRTTLSRRGLEVFEFDVLPPRLPWSAEILLVAREPRSGEEKDTLGVLLRRFLDRGGCVAVRDESVARDLLGTTEGLPGAFVVVPSEESVTAAADHLLLSRPRLRHPADGEPPGVDRELYRLPIPPPSRRLPAAVAWFLLVVTAVLAAVLVVLRRRGTKAIAAGLSLAAVAASAVGLLHLSGLLPGDVRRTDIVLEERARPDAAAVRRVHIVQFEQVSGQGGLAAAVLALGGIAVLDEAGGDLPEWVEVRYDETAPYWAASAEASAPGMRAIMACVEAARRDDGDGAMIGHVDARGDEVLAVEGLGAADRTGGQWPRSLADTLRRLARNGEPRVRLGAAAVEALLRRREGRFRIRFPRRGPHAVLTPIP